ncbi:sensor histidine kinase [Pedobacter metabolipauper]|uniref:histidine kinase n=1 Tax=Pedobacter metabolipauper TaxID=425513 RepID=A0A4R6T0R6_9SPHI|nr:HAMP domain-containing sensor histidine kinase [Pedobacter metabolipauper]TDQ11178.1 signal transduction histidine kinase [Pedobacter metabolipauper]
MLFIPVALTVNLFTKIPFVSPVLCTSFLLTVILYYNSRYLGNLRTSVILFSVILHVLLLLNYFFNSGVQGPTLVLFLLSMIFIIAVMPNRQYLFWVPLNAFLAILLIGIEYQYPWLIKNTYSSRIGFFTDTAFTYLISLIGISVVLTYILRSYQTEKKNVIAALKNVKKADESKVKLLSILSHDLKAPLNTIEGFLEMLVNYELEEDEKKAIKKSLLKETKNTQTMLFNMLSWTKSQMEGGIHVNLQHLNLQEALNVGIEIQQTAALEKMITLTTRIDPDVCIIGDMDMINLVVRNLLNNAIKFTNEGGEIQLTGKSVKGLAMITVRDNGIGIAPEKQQKLFFLNSGTTYGTANEKGVGLGLMLCKEFTELQGGKITFKSKPGIGTEFQVSLPLCDQKVYTIPNHFKEEAVN